MATPCHEGSTTAATAIQAIFNVFLLASVGVDVCLLPMFAEATRQAILATSREPMRGHIGFAGVNTSLASEWKQKQDAWMRGAHREPHLWRVSNVDRFDMRRCLRFRSRQPEHGSGMLCTAAHSDFSALERAARIRELPVLAHVRPLLHVITSRLTEERLVANANELSIAVPLPLVREGRGERRRYLAAVTMISRSVLGEPSCASTHARAGGLALSIQTCQTLFISSLLAILLM